MNNYFWAKDIKVTPTPFFYEYQEMFKAHNYMWEKIEQIAKLLIEKHGRDVAAYKYDMYTEARRDVLHEYNEVGFVESDTNVRVATVTLKREHFDWKDYNKEMNYWIEVWVCDELREFIGGVYGG